MTHDSLALAARLYLLAWDADRRRLTGTLYLDYLVRAGALTELVQRGLLVDADGAAKPVDDARAGDAALDGLLELIGESRPRTWKTWVSHRRKFTLETVRTQLVDSGILRRRTGRRFGLFPSISYELEHPELVREIREAARSVMLGAEPAEEISDRDAALVALAAAGELRTFASGKERRQYRARIEELTERSGATAPELKKVIKDVRAAMTVAITAASAGGAAAVG
ncbi:GOLPH3/VPS74 family protein [Streptomyces beijiangensis]|uniref:GPP34 family phosphoprotein n=1 Tax=Streptomyces beijiangensis TaxID=163361 RepID=A0A939JKH0_9ACTN|nr:GPP34 family phosphoprotein [Streptomyces beijiangensis]MBO0515807.1 GPP34 family phosphoprotein [Streptomyces beijiangensis]